MTDPTPLDLILADWRKNEQALLASFGPDPQTTEWEVKALERAKSMSTAQRIIVWENYRKIKATGDPRTIAENKWALILLSADRADNVRAKRDASKTASKANGSGTPPPRELSVDDLIG